jgi:hypothetical protein
LTSSVTVWAKAPVAKSAGRIAAAAMSLFMGRFLLESGC